MLYRPEIDGLRALAVVPVILFHAKLGPFSGGYVGVDVFFVISGYLITSFIIGDLSARQFSLTTFYARRARRILPALFVVLACTSVLAWIFMLPREIEEYARTLLANLAFISNFHFWKQSGYFAPDSEETPLLHTWSLAVEEQFYVLFPLAMLVLWRFGVRRLELILAIVALASFGLAEWASRAHPPAAFYLLPTRAWELLVGALCAVSQYQRGQMRNNALATLGALLILAAIFAFDEDTPFPSAFTLAPVLGAALIILFAAPETWMARALSLRPFVAIGLISYSAYLWHFPLFAFARIRSPYELSTALSIALIALTFALAWLTWKFVEQPFRRIKLDAKGLRQVFAGAALCATPFAAMGAFALSESRIEPIWLAIKGEHVREPYAALRATPPFGWESYDNGECRFDALRFTDENVARFDACVERHGPGVVILGDSHAINLYRALAQSSDFPTIMGVVIGGCRPHAPRPDCYYERFAEYARVHPQNIERVIFTQGGYYLLQDERGRPGYTQMFLRSTLPLFRMSERNVEMNYDYLAGLSQSVDVTWLGPRLEPRYDIRQLIEDGCTPGNIRLRDNIEEIFTQLDDDIRAYVAERRQQNPRLAYVSHLDIIQFSVERDMGDCTQFYWADPNHWSRAGELYFGAKLAPHLMPQNPTP